MIELIYGNKTERLLEELGNGLKEWRNSGAHPLEPVELVVPNRNMETYVRLGLAQSLGVAANLRFSFLNGFISRLVLEAYEGKLKLVDLDTVEAAVLTALTDEELLEKPEMQPVSRYLNSSGVGGGSDGFAAYLAADGADLRRVQLASRIAFLYQEYTFSRPEMIAAWRDKGSMKQADLARLPFADPAAAGPSAAATAAWQRALWHTVFGSGGILEQNPPTAGGRWDTMDLLAFDDGIIEKIQGKGLAPAHIFGVSYMARLYQHIFARLGEIGDLYIYSLNPCAEFWEDVETDREFFYRLDRELNRRQRRLWQGTGELEDEDPFGLFEADTPALRYWGRPGREHVRLLGELTDCDFTGAFENPCSESRGLLHRLQLNILLREPERSLHKEGDGADTAYLQADNTIKVVAAPSVRREVEWVADEIWRLMGEDHGGKLRFSDVAIIVNSAGRDLYLPHIEAVFDSCHGLPCSVSDLPGAAGSRMIEAMGLLLQLPFGRFSRAEMLTFLGHPAVIGSFNDLTPDDLTGIVDSLGIVFGADRSDHAGTYIDEDVFHWDQGLRRLALGAFMTGEKSGDIRIFATDEGRWLVEEISGTAVSTAARFGLLVRSLLSDARFVRDKQMTLTDWSRFYAAQLDSYFCVDVGADERDRLRLLHAFSRLEKMDLGRRVSGRVAAEIAGRTIDSLEGGRGQYLAEGVVVSSFLPMRAIPFKVVFLLGLGEGLFPASAQRDSLDLRAVCRRAGDVDPSERDRYMFLETLLCTRQRLYLSYVSRDEHTGDPLQPSAVVQELLHMLRAGYLGEEGLKSLYIQPPLQLRRYDEPFEYRDTFFDEARVEARVQEMARDWKARVSGAGSPGEELSLIQRIAGPASWAALSEMLALPGEPPDLLPPATASPLGFGGEEEILAAPVSFTLAVLRRFLECSMQGWASALLGLTELEEDSAHQEEEDFEISRFTELKLLNDVFYHSAASGERPEQLYRELSERLRLTGQYPVGAIGSVIEKKHLRVLEGWHSLLEGLQVEQRVGSNVGATSLSLHRVRIGQAREHGAAGVVLDPLTLEVPITGPDQQGRVVPVRLSGSTEGLSEDRLTSFIFLVKKPPAKNDEKTLTANFRYLLRGAVNQAVLTALGAAGRGERQVLICCADGVNSGGLKVRLQPLTAERAREWLTGIAAELLSGPHAYLLPCEAVYGEYHSRKGQQAGINGDKLCSLVKAMALNERAYFSSLWGPVPSPRLYEPPSAEEAVAIITRRFEPLFGDIIDLEVI